MRQFLRDLQTLIGTTAIAAFTGTAYFDEWAAMDATTGIARLGHAVMMVLLAGATLATGAVAIAVVLLWALEYPVARRARLRRERLASSRIRNFRVVATGAAIR